MSENHSTNDDKDGQKRNRGSKLSDYWPLLSLILVTALGGLAIIHHSGEGGMAWMHYFMGLFLTCFALLKIFNPGKFADGFEMYDLLAKRSRAYALAYPYIELALGLAYLSFTAPLVTYSLTIAVMVLGAIGVIKALREGLDINCPCMGSVLNVPLSTVTLTEDLGMAAMAAAMIVLGLI